MVNSKAATVEEYIAELPPDRREAITTVLEIVRQHLPDGYEEGMQYGMIGWYVPFSRLPKTYNGQPLGYAALASQKQNMTLYLNNLYGDAEFEAWFRERYAASGLPLHMAKSCVHFRRIEDLPLDLIGETIARTPLEQHVARYQATRGS
ncbi:MAG: DUF1801 domain-containing protein [Chloroflexota bacterium]|nr:DUF1801 domain-containing protein [Chloroflexota bacterium]